MGELIGGQRIDERFRGRATLRIHPHIERPLMRETETPVGPIQVKARGAEIRQDAVHLRTSQPQEEWLEVAVVVTLQMDQRLKLCETRASEVQRLKIPID